MSSRCVAPKCFKTKKKTCILPNPWIMFLQQNAGKQLTRPELSQKYKTWKKRSGYDKLKSKQARNDYNCKKISKAANATATIDELLKTKKSLIPNAGNGCFARVDLDKDFSLGKYAGQKLTKAQFEKKYPKNNAEYLLQLNKNSFIDGAVGGNLLSKINSSRGSGKQTNVAFTTQGTVRTTKKIKAGDELLISYGSAFKTL